MQVTNIPAVMNDRGMEVEAAGVRIRYDQDGQQFEAIRRPLQNGKVRYTVRNVTTGTEEVSEVDAASLEAV